MSCYKLANSHDSHNILLLTNIGTPNNSTILSINDYIASIHLRQNNAEKYVYRV